MKKQIRQKGFTLIELVVVIGIIGILIAVVAPIISDTIRQYDARAAARELIINFKKAKLAAVKHHREVFIDFFNVGGADCSYQIFVNVDRDANSPHTYDPGAGDILIETVTLDSDVQLISTTFPGPPADDPQAGYDPRGMPTQGNNQNIVLGAAGSRTYTLVIKQSGSVEVQ